MRTGRIKVAPEEGEAVYHCMSRVVNGERILDPASREILRKQLWQVADYCGVEILTYAILSNHFHVLVRVPRKQPLADSELLRRYAILYPKPTKYRAARLEVIKAGLPANTTEAERWRHQQQALMGDVSSFMKLVKQRFSIWFNKAHHRYGTLWAERFKSVLLEPQRHVLQTVGLYIDLNCVRAGLASDPKDYRFCGYGEAVAGSRSARAGIQCLAGEPTWAGAHDLYRTLLFGTGSAPAEGAATIPAEEFARVLRQKGRLPLATVLRCRVRYFTDAAVLGSEAFVALQLEAFRKRYGLRERTAPRPLPPITDWGGLTALRQLHRKAFGYDPASGHF